MNITTRYLPVFWISKSLKVRKIKFERWRSKLTKPSANQASEQRKEQYQIKLKIIIIIKKATTAILQYFYLKRVFEDYFHTWVTNLHTSCKLRTSDCKCYKYRTPNESWVPPVQLVNPRRQHKHKRRISQPSFLRWKYGERLFHWGNQSVLGYQNQQLMAEKTAR